MYTQSTTKCMEERAQNLAAELASRIKEFTEAGHETMMSNKLVYFENRSRSTIVAEAVSEPTKIAALAATRRANILDGLIAHCERVAKQECRSKLKQEIEAAIACGRDLMKSSKWTWGSSNFAQLKCQIMESVAILSKPEPKLFAPMRNFSCSETDQAMRKSYSQLQTKLSDVLPEISQRTAFEGPFKQKYYEHPPQPIDPWGGVNDNRLNRLMLEPFPIQCTVTTNAVRKNHPLIAQLSDMGSSFYELVRTTIQLCHKVAVSLGSYEYAFDHAAVSVQTENPTELNTRLRDLTRTVVERAQNFELFIESLQNLTLQYNAMRSLILEAIKSGQTFDNGNGFFRTGEVNQYHSVALLIRSFQQLEHAHTIISALRNDDWLHESYNYVQENLESWLQVQLKMFAKEKSK